MVKKYSVQAKEIHLELVQIAKDNMQRIDLNKIWKG